MSNSSLLKWLKIAVIGGGSTYTPELINGFLSKIDPLPIDELWLMDIDKERLDIVGGFARRMVAAKGNPFKVILSMNQKETISNADYVITQLRVGMMPARRGDEYLGRRHGLIGQETTGVGGMAKALRTIPVILDIARDIHQFAPQALLLNFTNPAGLVTEALSRYAAEVSAVGVCNVGITTKMHMLESLAELIGDKVEPHRVQLDSIGLNHLTWHRGLTLDGENIWPRFFPALVKQNREMEKPEWGNDLLESLGMIPNYYLHYFYYQEEMIKQQDNWPPSRAEEVMEIEKDLLREFSDPDLVEPPGNLMKRGGAYYSTLATQLIRSHFYDLGEIFIVNVKNNGAVPGWPADWVLELPAKIKKNGIIALPAKPLPLACYGLIAQVKSFELLTVEAAVHGNHEAAFQALLGHPLGPQAEKIMEVLDDMLKINKQWLPQF